MRVLWVYKSVTIFHALYEPTSEKREPYAGTSLRELVKEIKRFIGPLHKKDDIITVRFRPPGDAVISGRRIDWFAYASLNEEEIKQFIELFNKNN